MVVALLLAAGRSRRMGRQKLLLPFAGSMVVGHIVDELLSSPLDQVTVVTGRDGAAVRQALQGRTVHFVTNPDPDDEMLSSVRCGLSALPDRCESVLLALGDQPGIRRDLVSKLIDMARSDGKKIVVPYHDGHRGHPFLFPARYRTEIARQYDESGMRGFLDAHRNELLKIDVEDPSVLEDIDYPQDYLRALEQSSSL